MSGHKILLKFIGIVILFSLTNCCTTKNNIADEKQGMVGKKALIPLSQGMAEVICNVQEIFEKNNKLYCKIEINSVKRYGPGTQPIGVGSVMELELNENQKEKLKIFESNNEISNITIAQLRGGMGQEQKNSWKIINIKH